MKGKNSVPVVYISRIRGLQLHRRLEDKPSWKTNSINVICDKLEDGDFLLRIIFQPFGRSGRFTTTDESLAHFLDNDISYGVEFQRLGSEPEVDEQTKIVRNIRSSAQTLTDGAEIVSEHKKILEKTAILIASEQR